MPVYGLNLCVAAGVGWSDPGLLHWAVMDNLQPGVRYMYCVGDLVGFHTPTPVTIFLQCGILNCVYLCAFCWSQHERTSSPQQLALRQMKQKFTGDTFHALCAVPYRLLAVKLTDASDVQAPRGLLEAHCIRGEQIQKS